MQSSPAPSAASFDALLHLLRGRRVVVLAGAGCSTESGIPDYRGPEGSLRTRKPMQYQEFVRSEAGAGPLLGAQRGRLAAHGRRAARTRRTARSPRLEEAGVVRGVITQNVDGLHQAAGQPPRGGAARLPRRRALPRLRGGPWTATTSRSGSWR